MGRAGLGTLNHVRLTVDSCRQAGLAVLGVLLVHTAGDSADVATDTNREALTATLSVPGYILGEVALSLLGLGIQDPHASWGNLLSEAMAIAQVRFHPWVLWPGACIFLTVMAYNFLGDGLRDAFDPRAQSVRQ